MVYPIPVINPPLFVSGKLNEPFSYTITATGSPTSYGATGLPSWLSAGPGDRRDLRHADRGGDLHLHNLGLQSGGHRDPPR